MTLMNANVTVCLSQRVSAETERQPDQGLHRLSPSAHLDRLQHYCDSSDSSQL